MEFTKLSSDFMSKASDFPHFEEPLLYLDLYCVLDCDCICISVANACNSVI